MGSLEKLVDALQHTTYELSLEIESDIHVIIRKEEEYESPETSFNISSKEENLFLLLHTAFPNFYQIERDIERLNNAPIELIYEGQGNEEDLNIDLTSDHVKIYHHFEKLENEEIFREQLNAAFQITYAGQLSDRKLLIEGQSRNLDKLMSESYLVLIDALSQLVEGDAVDFSEENKKYKDLAKITENLRKSGNLTTPEFLNSNLKSRLEKNSIRYLAWEIIARATQDFSTDLIADAKYLKTSKEHELSKNAKKLSKFYSEINEIAVYSSRQMKLFLENETETYRNLHGVEISTPPIEEIKDSLLNAMKRTIM